jgi:hypothetical protein
MVSVIPLRLLHGPLPNVIPSKLNFPQFNNPKLLKP